MEPAAVLAVVVKARGVAQTNTQLNTVHKTLQQTEKAGAALATNIARSGKQMETTGRKMVATGMHMKHVGMSMSMFVTLPLVAIGAAAIKTAADFDKSMAQVGIATHQGGKKLKQMEHLALEMGAKTIFSANQASEAMLNLVKAGLSPAEVKGGALAATMNLAAAGGEDLARSGNLIGAAMNTFNMKAKDSVRIADALAGGANASSADISDLTLSLQMAGQAASMMDVSLFETVGTLAAFADQGLRSSDAGTSFKTFLIRLNPVQKKQKELMDELNLSFFNQRGHMVSMAEVSRRLREALGGMTDQQRNAALATLFGSDAIRAANIVYKSGPKGIKAYTRATEEQGAAQKMAQAQMKGLPGSVERLKGSLETAALAAGNAAAPAIISVAGAIESVANGFIALPKSTQATIVAIGAVVAAAGPLIWVAGFIVTQWGRVFIVVGKLLQLLGLRAATTSATTVAANEAAAASYLALAESIKVASTAQEELLIANKSGVVTSTVPIATGTTAAAETAGTTAATGWVSKFVGGIVRFLPAAAAVFGIGNIISSIIGGNEEKAAFKAGGGIAGAIAGGVAFGLPGALAGFGIGTILGGALGDLFDSEKDLTAFQESVRRSAGEVASAMNKQKAATDALSSTNQQLSTINKHQKNISHQVKRAEQDLADVREHHKAGSPAVIQAEAKLSIWKSRNIRLSHQQSQAEKIHGIELWGFKKAASSVIIKMRERAYLLDEEREKAARKLLQDKKNHAGLEEVEKDYRRLSRVSKEYRENSGQLGSKLQEVAQMAGEKFARHLKTQSLPALRAVQSGVKDTNQLLRRLNIQPAGQMFKIFGDRASGGTGKAKKGIMEVSQQLGPFQAQTHTKMQQAGQDVTHWKETSVSGVDKVKETVGGFASELGISSVSFGVHKKGGRGKGQGKQTGGMVVPGRGTGDKVPLSAMVEPGEIVHVLNMRAAKDRKKLAALEHLNSAVPRFQSGGALGIHRAYAGLSGDTDFYPALGFALSKMALGSNTHINVASGWRSIAEQAALYRAYQAGTGNLAAAPSPNAPHVRGFAADITPGREKFGGSAGRYGLAFTVPSESWHIELLKQMAGALGGFTGTTPHMPGFLFTGPNGLLTQMGQGTVDSAAKMAQQFLNQNVGAGGIGNVPTGPVQKMAQQMVANLWGSGQWAPFNALEMSEAGWDYKAVNPSSGAAGLAQALPPSKYPPGAWPPSGLESAKLQLQWMMGYIKDRYGDPASAWAFHQANNWYQKGGILGLAKGGSISAGMKNVLKGMSEGKHLPKYRGALAHLKKRIGGVGLSDRQLEDLDNLTKDANKYAEFAGNASTLTTQTEDGVVTLGQFKGHDEAYWLNQQLGSLMGLRNHVISAHDQISSNQIPRIDKLLGDARARLRHVRRVIREAEEHKREIEKKIKEIEHAHDVSKQQAEKEIQQLERELDKAQSAKHPDKGQIEVLRGEIKNRKQGMSQGDQAITEEIRKMNEEVRDITRQNRSRGRVESALSDGIIPSLTEKQAGLHGTLGDLFEDGGKVNTYSFSGLRSIQGPGGSLGDIPNPPDVAEVGGELFNVLNRLREIDEDAKRVSKASAPSESSQEIASLANEIALEWQRKYLVSQAQFQVLKGFPSVPYAGSFASGGVMAAEVGEKGREFVFAPRGARVVSNQEANSALKESSGTTVIIDQLIINEDGTASIRLSGGQTAEAVVRSVTRKQARSSMSPTPGGAR